MSQCPKGQIMSNGGVCINPNENHTPKLKQNFYAAGGLTRDKNMIRSECLDNCEDLMGQYNSCMMGNDTGGACSCQQIPYWWGTGPGGSGDCPGCTWEGTYQNVCSWMGASPMQCYTGCGYTAGSGYGGGIQGRTGTNRRIGGPIRPIQRMRRRRR